MTKVELLERYSLADVTYTTILDACAAIAIEPPNRPEKYDLRIKRQSKLPNHGNKMLAWLVGFRAPLTIATAGWRADWELSSL